MHKYGVFLYPLEGKKTNNDDGLQHICTKIDEYDVRFNSRTLECADCTLATKFRITWDSDLKLETTKTIKTVLKEINMANETSKHETLNKYTWTDKTSKSKLLNIIKLTRILWRFLLWIFDVMVRSSFSQEYFGMDF